MEKPSIAVIGAGWLGTALAIHLEQNGFAVKASSRKQEKLDELQSKNISTFYFNLEDPSTFRSKLFDADIYVICLSLSIPTDKLTYWENIITEFLTYLKSKKPKKVLLMSSIGLISNLGKTINELDAEHLALEPSYSLIAENSLQKLHPWPGFIFRLGGLIGPGRDLTKHFSGKSNIPNGLAPVNLIHLRDLVDIIHKAIEENLPNNVLHIIHNQHPSRMDFYTNLCQIMQKPLPTFSAELKDWKIIDSAFLSSWYNFKIDLMDLSPSDFKA